MMGYYNDNEPSGVATFEAETGSIQGHGSVHGPSGSLDAGAFLFFPSLFSFPFPCMYLLNTLYLH
jgi:hypothetical protein